jgi:superfamily II RNA helicase
VKLLFATETFAVGINMPTKTVVFTGYRKYDDLTGGMRMLNTDEYIQMAGRAGRRGKDDKGLVLYLPDRESEDMADVQRMMTGARQTFQSRMTFHYDFLLKTLQSGNLDWLKLMRQSYWYRRHEILVRGIEGELKAAEASAAAIEITVEEAAAMEEREALASRLKQSVNAAKKEAQKAWSAWENGHMGPRWTALVKEVWPKFLKAHALVKQLKTELAGLEDPSRGVWPSLDALAVMGFLKRPVQDEAPELTPLGTMATEVNEGHPILMSQTYEKGLLKDLSAEEIMSALLVFSGEAGRDMPAVDSLDVPRAVGTALWGIHAIGQEDQRLEESVGAPRAPRDSYWDLNTTWIEPVWRWLQGATVQDICADYDIYEGNFMRLLSKTVNLLEEWRSLATLSKDTEMLEKMRGLETKLTRDLAAGDSLYLRL